MGNLGKRLLLLLCCFAILILFAGLYAWLSDRGFESLIEVLAGIMAFVFIGIIAYTGKLKH